MAATTMTSNDPVYDTFIRRSLGTYLPECIKQLAEARPADPIEFISNWLYKAMDSQLYKREKEKYLKDCVKEFELLQQERQERKARMEMLLQAQKENKEELRQARQDEINALMDLAKNAEKLGAELSPKSIRRLNLVRKISKLENDAEKPLEITMPKNKKQEQKKSESKGRWVEVEEEIMTENGTVVTVKTRKWQPAAKRGDGTAEGEIQDEKESHKELKLDHSSVFSGGQMSPLASQGIIGLSSRGVFTFQSEAMGIVEPPDPLNRQLTAA
ncbi:hypothetical protein RRG08_013213, partial [Elysia crispata]